MIREERQYIFYFHTKKSFWFYAKKNTSNGMDLVDTVVGYTKALEKAQELNRKLNKDEEVVRLNKKIESLEKQIDARRKQIVEEVKQKGRYNNPEIFI